MNRHMCHAYGCLSAIPPSLLMCIRHWRMVPKNIQQRVWQEYRPGQEIDKSPSNAYMLVQRAAVWAVYVAEGKCEWSDVPQVGSAGYMIGPAVLRKGAR